MLDLSLKLLWISILIGACNLIFGLIRTYYARYSKKTYKGSVKYWESWKERKFDVAEQVLREIGIDSKKDLKRLMKRMKKEK